MSTKHLIFSLGLCSLALTGCASSYDHEEITNTSTGDLQTTVSLQKISIPVGAITVANVIPYNSDHNPMIGTVTSDDPNVLLIEGAVDNKWSFSGVSAGTATVHFVSDGAVVATVTATVTVQ